MCTRDTVQCRKTKFWFIESRLVVIGGRRCGMTKSMLLDVLEVKKGRLEALALSRRRLLEMFSSASLLARIKQEGIIATNRNDPVAASPHTKSAKRGGRKRLASEKQRFYLIGRAVDEQFCKF